MASHKGVVVSERAFSAPSRKPLLRERQRGVENSGGWTTCRKFGVMRLPKYVCHCRYFCRRVLDEALFSEKKGFSVKRGHPQLSVNERFGKDFYRTGNSVKSFVQNTEPPDSENRKVAVLIPFPKISSYFWTPHLPYVSPTPLFWRLSVISLKRKRHRPDQSQFLRPPKVVLESTLFSTFPPPPPPNSGTGRIRFRGVRFQTPNSVSFFGLTEFRGANSVSSSQPIICVPK